MSRILVTSALLAAAVLGGCATEPMGPTARVLPAPGKPFEAFASDQSLCKQFAGGEVRGGAELADLKRLGGAMLTAGLGTGLGAAIDRRQSPQIGAALGGIMGASTGANGSARDQNDLQYRYDLAYTQCMYSRGNQVAGAWPYDAGRGGYPSYVR